MKTLSFGLIGGGRWAAIHRDAIHAAGHRLTQVCVRSAERCAQVRAEWDVPVTRQLNELLETELDAVIVASPNDLHAEHAIACLRAGKHVMVEKPMALTIADCRAMQAAAKEAGRVLVPGMQMRLFGHFAALHAALPALGRLRWLSLQLWRKPHGGGAGNWRDNDARRGSLWLEEPIHYLDLLSWYMGDPPQRLTAWNSAPGVMQARLEWQSGAAASFEYSLRAAGHTVTVHAVGDKAAAELTWAGEADRDPQPRVTCSQIENGNRRGVEVPLQCGHSHDGPKLVEAFAAACAGAKPLGLPTADDGCSAVAWSLAAAQSCVEKRALTAQDIFQ